MTVLRSLTAQKSRRDPVRAEYGGLPHSLLDETTSSADLAAWIAWAFRPSMRGRRRCDEDSYALKHRAERQIGRYVNEDEFKAAMVAAGYEPMNPRKGSWRFRAAFRHPMTAYEPAL